VLPLAAVVIAADQGAKQWALTHLAGNRSISLAGGWMHLHLLVNAGAAFSTATGMTWVLTVIAVGLGIAVVLGVQLARAGLDSQAAQAASQQAGDSSLDVRVGAGSGLNDDEVEALSNLGGVLQAVPLYEKRVIAAPVGNGFSGLTVTVVGLQDGAAALRPVQVLAGHLPAPDSTSTVAVDQDLAGALVGKPGKALKLGDQIQLITATGPDVFRVVGFTNQAGAGPAFTRSAVFVSRATITTAFGPASLIARLTWAAVWSTGLEKSGA